MLRRAPALRHAGVVFIRKTATRARRDGGSYTSFRLVESVSSGSQVSQRTLLNLGSGFAVHLDSLEHSRVRSVDCERLALHALDQLGLQDALRAQGVSTLGDPRAARPGTGQAFVAE